MEKISSIFQSKRIIKLIFLFLALITIYRIGKVAAGNEWKDVKGDEYYWIAQSIAAGQGFSFSADHRWLFVDFKSKYPSTEYHPTAWEEPVYPYSLGLAMKYFGDQGRLLILILQSIAVYFTSLFIFLITKRVFKSEWGVLSSIIFMLFWPEIRFLSEGTFAPPIFAGLGLSGSTLVFLWFLDKISIKRGIILGIVFGISCLTLAAIQLTMPIMVLLTFYFARMQKTIVWREVLAVVLAFIVILMPWTIRNYSVFGEFVPFRNGVGQGLHMSNQMVAATFNDGKFACEDSLGPIWKVDNAKTALESISVMREKRMAIYKRAYECIELEAPTDYAKYNEAQRDKIYLQSAVNFIVSNPMIFMNLAYQKVKMLMIGWNKRHSFVAILGIIGMLLSWKNKKVLVLVLITFGYIIPFSLIGAWFYRYRYPVEPILLILASGIPILFINMIRMKLFKGIVIKDKV